MRRFAFLALCILIGFAVAPTLAQDAPHPGVEITSPLPVTEVWGTNDVLGTAAVSGMAYYYLEYLPLNDDLSLPENVPWLPATLAIENVVNNGVLASVDTTKVADGLYALRLVVNTRSGQTFTDTVSPIRVSNERFTQVKKDILLAAGLIPTEEPTAAPTSAPVDNSPRATPSGTAVNVRRCDIVDNQACPVLGFLPQGEWADILAISANNTGWFQIRLSSGLVGWVSPTVVVTSGDTSNLPRVAPPPALPPPTSATVIPNAIAIQGGVATCGQTFNAQVNVTNIGNAASPAGSVSLQNVNTRTGAVTFTSFGGFPSLNPGANFVVVIPVTITVYFNETQELRAFAGGQQASLTYVLQQGTCGVPATLPPSPTLTATQPSPTQVQPTAVQPTAVPPTVAPPTAVPPTAVPPTVAPPTAVPPTAVPPTAVPPTVAPPSNPAADFPAGQCNLVLASPTGVYDAPNGNSVGTADPGTYNASRVEQVNQVLWYRLTIPNIGQAWVNGAGIEQQGNCALA